MALHASSWVQSQVWRFSLIRPRNITAVLPSKARVVPAQTEIADVADSDAVLAMLVGDHDRPLGEQRRWKRIPTLGTLITGADMNEPKRSGVGDGEARPDHVVRLELSVPRLVGELAYPTGDGDQPELVGVTDGGDDEPLLIEVYGDPEVDPVVEHRLALLEVVGAVDHREGAESADRCPCNERQVGEREKPSRCLNVSRVLWTDPLHRLEVDLHRGPHMSGGLLGPDHVLADADTEPV